MSDIWNGMKRRVNIKSKISLESISIAQKSFVEIAVSIRMKNPSQEQNRSSTSLKNNTQNSSINPISWEPNQVE